MQRGEHRISAAICRIIDLMLQKLLLQQISIFSLWDCLVVCVTQKCTSARCVLVQTKVDIAEKIMDEAVHSKCVVTGDSGVGKTCILMTHDKNKFPSDYVPTVYDNFTSTINLEDTTVIVDIYDMNNTDETFDRSLRLLDYSRSSVCAMVFSIIFPASFENIRTKWHPESCHHLPGVPQLLIGAKSDLRTDKATLSALKKKGQAPITALQAQTLAKEIGAVGYFECSALKNEGISEIFEQAARAALGYITKDTPVPKPKRCTIT
eukprot:TRINITY_DN1923_c0_g1_i2.p1 TRINITY_DN1923_c0_g1~~TRINITY_DN1923_c0_g1_i2.p1  ORF type:complete len:264 (-),score=26.39 TRINITY_DN1923_c0_g1_i2:154-945(-)